MDTESSLEGSVTVTMDPAPSTVDLDLLDKEVGYLIGITIIVMVDLSLTPRPCHSLRENYATNYTNSNSNYSKSSLKRSLERSLKQGCIGSKLANCYILWDGEHDNNNNYHTTSLVALSLIHI